jgi:hypothetical protein
MREVMEQLQLGIHSVLFQQKRALRFGASIPSIQTLLVRKERCVNIAARIGRNMNAAAFPHYIFGS